MVERCFLVSLVLQVSVGLVFGGWAMVLLGGALCGFVGRACFAWFRMWVINGWCVLYG